YCSWLDLNDDGVTTGIVLSFSDDRGATWSRPAPVGDRVAGVDRFNHWLSVDPLTGQVTVAYYDTRNDTTGSRFQTDLYLARLASMWSRNSASESPPIFSRSASAATQHTTASPTTPAACTTQVSLRSTEAASGSLVRRSMDRRGTSRVGMGLTTPRARSTSP